MRYVWGMRKPRLVLASTAVLCIAAHAQAQEKPEVAWRNMQGHITSAYLAGTGSARLVSSSQALDQDGTTVLITFWFDSPAHYRCFDLLDTQLITKASRCDGPGLIAMPNGWKP